MTEQLIHFEAGEVLANFDDRTITGLLLPFGEIGRTNAGEFAVEAGAIEIPADPAVIGLNTDHERSAVVGRAERVWEEARGIFATFRIAKTPEGDAALEAVRNGTRSRLSAEFQAVIDGARKIATKGKLWGSGLVARGAFPSAAVLAAEAAAQQPQPVQPIEGAPVSQPVQAPTAEVAAAAPVQVAATAPVNPVHAPAPAGHTTPANGGVQTVLATLGEGKTPEREAARQVLATIFNAFEALRTNPHDAAARDVLAALNDIKTTTLQPGHVTQPNWVGLILQGLAYEREYITLGNLGTAISFAGKQGFKVNRGSSSSPVDSYASAGDWAGNKAAIGSFQGFSAPVTSTRRNFALGADFAREFNDLPGGAEAAAALMTLIVEDYFVWSDMHALTDWNTVAGTLVSPKTYPTDYPAVLGMLIQGILAVRKRKGDGRRDTPTFAIVNDYGYEQLLYAAGGDENLPAFINVAVNTASRGTVDGITVVNGDVTDNASTPAPIEDSPAVLVGASYAIDFDELPGNAPLTIDALHIANGGIDRAVHGYLQTFVKRPEAVVKVGTADTPAAG